MKKLDGKDFLLMRNNAPSHIGKRTRKFYEWKNKRIKRLAFI